MHNSIEVNKGKDVRGKIERRVSIASSGLGDYKLSASEGDKAQDAASGQPALPKKKVSYSKDSVKQQDLGAIAQQAGSQKANQLNAGGWTK